jgi:hypothetical protein
MRPGDDGLGDQHAQCQQEQAVFSNFDQRCGELRGGDRPEVEQGAPAEPGTQAQSAGEDHDAEPKKNRGDLQSDHGPGAETRLRQDQADGDGEGLADQDAKRQQAEPLRPHQQAGRGVCQGREGKQACQDQHEPRHVAAGAAVQEGWAEHRHGEAGQQADQRAGRDRAVDVPGCEIRILDDGIGE